MGTTNGSLSGTFRLRYGTQATVPLDANASAEAVEVSFTSWNNGRVFNNKWVELYRIPLLERRADKVCRIVVLRAGC